MIFSFQVNNFLQVFYTSITEAEYKDFQMMKKDGFHLVKYLCEERLTRSSINEMLMILWLSGVCS